MKKKFSTFITLSLVTASVSLQTAVAQNTSPYWSLSGNSNATSGSKLGTTNSTPLRFFTNNSERVRIDASGKVGIGTSNPLNILMVKLSGGTPSSSWLAGGSSLPAFLAFGENQATGFNLATAADASGYRPVLNTRRSRGTLASPSAVHNNDFLASFVASGYDGNTFQNPATIDFYVDGTPSSGSVPGRISFVTGTNVGDRKERLKVGNSGNFNFNDDQLFLQQSNGNVGIGTTSPGYKLTVLGGSTSGIYTSTSGSYGVVAYSSATYGYGLYGSSGYLGVYGNGGSYGVFGSSSNSAYGVYGSSSTSYSANGSSGVYGSAYYGVQGSGTYGIYGKGTYAGLYGTATGSYTYGALTYGGYVGTYGNGTTYGIYGYAPAGSTASVYGYTPGTGVGVYGYNASYGYGVRGYCQYGAGVYGSSGSGYAGFFAGNVYSGGSFVTSDRKLKKDITDFTSAMDIINKLKPKLYEFRQDGNYKLMNLPKGQHYGLIAQDLELVLPGLVNDSKFDPNMERPMTAADPKPGTAIDKPALAPASEVIDFKAVNYTELIPVMIKAMQEQEAKIEALTQLVNQLSQNNTSGVKLNSASLSNAVPNPASGSTRISYSVPTDFVRAEMVITNEAGQKIKQIQLSKSGLIDIDTSKLGAGVYSYTLFVDGALVNTKKMIVTR